MGLTYLITYTTEFFCCPYISSEAGMFLEVYMVHYDVVMDMSLIYVRGDNIFMPVVGIFTGKLYPYLMSLLRGNLSLCE